jgi:hypothetical protein
VADGVTGATESPNPCAHYPHRAAPPPTHTRTHTLLGALLLCAQGAEDSLKSYRYFLVFQREYVEELGELQWKLADFAPAGDEDQLF